MEESFYSAQFPRVYRYFTYRGVPALDSEDLAQEVFFRYFTRYGERSLTEDDATKVTYGIAKRVYLEWLRQMKKDRCAPFDENTDYGGSVEEFIDPEFEARITSLGVLLEEGIATLHPNYQAVINGRFRDEKSRADLAAELGMSEKQVHVYQRRAIAQLQVWVAARTPEEPPPVSPST